MNPICMSLGLVGCAILFSAIVLLIGFGMGLVSILSYLRRIADALETLAGELTDKEAKETA